LHRKLGSYKGTKAGAKIDPNAAWTGTWRGPRFSPPADGGRPENALTGQIFTVNDGPGSTTSIVVPEVFGKRRLWRNTSIATLPTGATATLPVKLAVALLADRNGVIDINLPVSGSLNDPQFKLAPIVFKLIVNLIVKAITSPFSLLASAFGGGADELSVVSFAPGSAILAPQARPGLDKVAKALIERPALKMTVVGTASLEVERDAFKRERLNALVRAEKRRAALVSGASVQSLEAEAVDVTAAEYPVLLKAVYRRADFPKPRNLLGIAKDIPPNEMEALLLAHLAVTEDAMRELAVQWGVAVRDYPIAQKLPSGRLFPGAAKAVSAEAKWSPRAELNLGTR